MQEETFTGENFSDRLARALKARGVKATPLAKKIGLSAGYVSDLLKGVKDNPSLELIQKLSRELNISPNWLAGKGGAMMELSDEVRKSLRENLASGDSEAALATVTFVLPPQAMLDGIRNLLDAGTESGQAPEKTLIEIATVFKLAGYM